MRVVRAAELVNVSIGSALDEPILRLRSNVRSIREGLALGRSACRRRGWIRFGLGRESPAIDTYCSRKTMSTVLKHHLDIFTRKQISLLTFPSRILLEL